MKKTYLSYPEDWDDLTDAEQDEVAGQMADVILAEQFGISGGEP